VSFALKPYLNLGHIFAKPKDPVKRKHILYILYHVVTARKSNWVSLSGIWVSCQFGTRPKEHQMAVSTLSKEKSALAEHVCDTKHKIAWENSKVMNMPDNHYGQRRCLEAWHINMSNHALSRDDGAYSPDEYMHLISR
jgi:hypothetical protein